ncbi:4-hydroxybenzoate octaprenyltransferase [Candidatus Bandiella numerosa]|uniref:4-hydroxybenzoate octaprenyltransferase n=1 Tax=Candidatus Bandiella numerosa TaxID=2570586 RepID=UPI001F01EED3|nr:4-hydroxybenzoate octaprenyltransferase [Candidatus Bandiella numerosa]
MKKQPSSNFQSYADKGNAYVKQKIRMIEKISVDFFKFADANPYARLMRLHQPVGTQLVMMPVLWTLAVVSYDILHFLCLFIIFTFGAVIMRGAGVVINDIIDRDIDKYVERTKMRPLASGELTLKNAVKFLLVLLIIGLFILLLLPPKSIYFGILTTGLIMVYPLIKRYSYYPQIFLGATFNLGIFIAWFSVEQYISFVPILIYIASIFWTIGYDTIYAHQDKKDDEKIGVKSTAIAFGDNTKEIVRYLYKFFIFSLDIAGLNANLNVIFFIVILMGFFMLSQQIDNVDLNSPEDCLKKVKSNFAIGMLIFFGFAIGCI